MDEAQQKKLLAQLQELRDNYAKELPEKIRQIREGLDTLRANRDTESLRTLHRYTHSLTGSGATFGFAEVSTAARKLEQALKNLIGADVELSDQAIHEMEPLLCALEQSEQKSSTSATDGSTLVVAEQSAVQKIERRLVFVVDDDTSVAGEQRIQYELHGYQVRVFHGFDGLEDAIRKEQPQAIIMDVVFPEGDLAGIEKIAALRRAVDRMPPVIFLSQREDLQSRLASVRAGAVAYYVKPVDLASMIETLDRLTTHDKASPYRVMVIDDDESLAYYNALTLQQGGIETRVVTDPTEALEQIANFQPELILMDLYMPACTGIELAAVIRQQEAYVGMPIVFFSVETDIAKHLDAMRAGGDDFLTKPITPAHLLATVEARVRRARTITSLMVRDSLTGLLTHSAIEEQLTRELGLQLRHEGILSYAMIDLDHFKQVNDRYGHAAGDRVIRGLSRLLRQRFRQTDLLGRYGGEEFVVILPATDAQTAARLLDNVRKTFSQIKFMAGDQVFTSTFSAGVASAPPYNDIAKLQAEADRLLYRAKEAGRNQVLFAE